MKSIKPIYGQDYAPGFTLFTRRPGSFISDGISWFESNLEVSEFYPSHVVRVLNEYMGIECDEAGIHTCYLDKYFNNEYNVICREPDHLSNTAWSNMREFAKSRTGRL